jgi:hypothetical protein
MRSYAPCLIAILASGPASGAIVADTFGPGTTFDQHGYYSWSQQPVTLRIGFRFTAGAGGGLTDLTTAVYHPSTGSAAGARFDLYDDNAGLPGALLGSWAAPTPGANYSATTFPPALHLSLDGSVQVAQGQTYYFIVDAESPFGRIDWFLNPTGNTGTQVYQYQPGPWLTEPQPQPFGAFRLETVPGPGGLSVVAGAAVIRRRRR